MAWACPCPHLLKVRVTSISWPQWNNMSNEWSNDLWSTQNLNINWLCTHVQTRWLGNPCDTDLDVVWAGFPSMLPIIEFAPGIKNADPKNSTVWVANPCWGTNSFQSMMWESYTIVKAKCGMEPLHPNSLMSHKRITNIQHLELLECLSKCNIIRWCLKMNG